MDEKAINIKGKVLEDLRESGGGDYLPPCEMEPPGPFCLVVFGASGDLNKRKIMPAIYRLMSMGLLPQEFCVIGTSRTALSDEQFKDMMSQSVKQELGQGYDDATWQELAARLYYVPIDYANAATYKALGERIEQAEQRHDTKRNRIFYLSVPPTVYEDAITNLGASGLSREEAGSGGFTRVVIEKPFGRDLASALSLNTTTERSFGEHQVYRMDHYLAKETVQNVLMFRFANSIFEPLWNQRYIDHVQITAAETLGVEHRAGYYEKSGVIRDMFQNHILQLLALTAMEPPARFDASHVQDEKVKVLSSVRPVDLEHLDKYAVQAQYVAGKVGQGHVPGYRQEPDVAPDSTTATYCAMKLLIDNWRWKGVPFYLRSGKRLRARKAEIAIRFKNVPHLMFARTMHAPIDPNTLVLRVQPDEGVSLVFQTKRQGSKVCLDPVKMDFSYPKALSLEAYERVLLDCMSGDHLLFVRDDAVKTTWKLVTPVIERLEQEARSEGIEFYEAGSDGPRESSALLKQEGHAWRPL